MTFENVMNSYLLPMRLVSVRVIILMLGITGTIYLSSTAVGHRANLPHEDNGHGHEAVKAFQAKIQLRCANSTRKIELYLRIGKKPYLGITLHPPQKSGNGTSPSLSDAWTPNRS